jgi:hypothetical protein
MGSKLKALPARSFRDALGGEFKQTVQVAAAEKSWQKWDAQGQMLGIVADATKTLQTWLTARLEELVRERVPLDDLKVHHDGARTVIYVRGLARYEFKIKCSMGIA